MGFLNPCRQNDRIPWITYYPSAKPANSVTFDFSAAYSDEEVFFLERLLLADSIPALLMSTPGFPYVFFQFLIQML